MADKYKRADGVWIWLGKKELGQFRWYGIWLDGYRSLKREDKFSVKGSSAKKVGAYDSFDEKRMVSQVLVFEELAFAKEGTIVW